MSSIIDAGAVYSNIPDNLVRLRYAGTSIVNPDSDTYSWYPKVLTFVQLKNFNFVEGISRYMRSLQPTKKTTSTSKNKILHFLLFIVGHSCWIQFPDPKHWQKLIKYVLLCCAWYLFTIVKEILWYLTKVTLFHVRIAHFWTWFRSNDFLKNEQFRQKTEDIISYVKENECTIITVWVVEIVLKMQNI